LFPKVVFDELTLTIVWKSLLEQDHELLN